MVSSLSSGPFSDFSESTCDSRRKMPGPEVRPADGGGAAGGGISVADVWDPLRGGAGPGGGGPGGGPLGGPRLASCLWGTGGGTPGGWNEIINKSGFQHK